MIPRFLAALIVAPLRFLFAVVRFILLLPFRRKVRPWASLKAHGTLPWRTPRRQRWKVGKRPGPSIQAIEERLEAAAGEPGLRGIVVHTEDLHADPSRLAAVGQALERFRRSGKEVVLYWKQATARDFDLAPSVDRILLAPGGMVLLVGHAASMTSWRGGLDKVGVVGEFVRIGRWKTAPERFTRPDISPEHRAFVEEVLDHRQERLLAGVASRRGGDREWAKAVIDRGPYTSRRALDAGLVDALVYPDDLASFLRDGAPSEAKSGSPRVAKAEPMPAAIGGPSHGGRAGNSGEARDPKGHEALPSLARLHASRRWRMRWPRLLPRQIIAVVPIDGLIKPGRSLRLPGMSAMAGERTVAEALARVRKDPRIKGVIVSIDSRGGAAPASELMWRAVRRCAEEKPTVAYVESVAASGGYFAAAGASRIVATPGALLGSIGVFSGRFDTRALFERLGIHQEVVLRGANAGLLEPAHALSDREREVMQAEIAAVYEEFVARVAEGRGRTTEEIRGHGEGRVFVAGQAPPAIVDEIGDFRVALAWVCTQAKLQPARVEVRVEDKLGAGDGLASLLALAQTVNGIRALLGELRSNAMDFRMRAEGLDDIWPGPQP